MLKLFRENLRSLSWVLWIVIIVFVLLIFADVRAFAPGGAAGGPNARAAWADDGIEVTYAEYKRFYEGMASRYRQYLGDRFTPEMDNQIKIQALNSSLDRKILVREARKMGLRVSDDELRKAILELPVFKDEAGRFVGDERYERAVRYMGYPNSSEFEAALRDDLLTDKLDEALRSSVYVSDQEVEDAYRGRTEKAKIRYVRVRNAQFNDQVSVTPEDVQAYYDAHTADYLLPEQRTAAYLLVDNAKLREQVEIPEEDVQAYYDANQDEYQTEEQVRARHILLRTDQRSAEEAEAELNAAKKRIEGGEDFAKVAQEISEDPGSRDAGGDLRYFGRGRMVPEFEKQAFEAPVGQLVGPFQSAIGFHLLEVTDHRQGGLRPFDEVKTQIRYRLLSERLDSIGEEKAGELLAKLKDVEGSTEDALKKLAEETDFASFEVTQPFDRQGVISGIGRSVEFATKTFELSEGQLSDPVKVPRGWAILTLDKVLEPRQQELSEVEARVTQAVRQEKLQQVAEQQLNAARDKIASGGETLDQLAKSLGSEVQESDSFTQGGALPDLSSASGTVVAKALTLDEGAVGGPIEMPQGYVLFQVTEREKMDPAGLANQTDALRTELETQKYQRLRTAILEQRRLDLKAVYAPALAEQLGIGDTAGLG
ncbi:MAG: peptidyl-prolyl cis-trans isomerase [Acidobacteria bacterium]|nr:peptidyl-prolyl cis-trans isomerase [Acidobacteriota bacterium]